MPKPVRTDIAGSVFRILKAPGDAVEAGETVLIVEAMKMEIAVASEQAGRIATIEVSQDDMIEEDQVIATLEDAR
jgi:biotin carboxyl carrier protein